MCKDEIIDRNICPKMRHNRPELSQRSNFDLLDEAHLPSHYHQCLILMIDERIGLPLLRSTVPGMWSIPAENRLAGSGMHRKF